MTASPTPFSDLTPARIFAAVDETGVRATGRSWQLGALENRVYEVEREDDSRVVVKFYRPGRHPTAAIEDEHALLAALFAEEVPVVPPLALEGGATLRIAEDGHRFAVFPKAPGRAPDEISAGEYERIGRLIARMHNVSAALALSSRPTLSPATYGTVCIERTLTLAELAPGTRGRYEDAGRRVVTIAEELFRQVPSFVTHADCHRGNVLSGAGGFFFLDFDDAARAPAVQDLWLLLPGRAHECGPEIDAWIKGYETFRPFDEKGLALIEALRALRYLRYAAWIAERREDPAFKAAFPQYGTGSYWEGLVGDLYEQIRQYED